MANPKVRINSKQARALLNGADVQKLMEGIVVQAAADANALARIPGAEYVGDVEPGVNRAHGMVKTTNYESRLDNGRNNTLLKGWPS